MPADNSLTYPFNLTVQGDFAVTGQLSGFERTKLTQENFASFDVPLLDLRVWDAAQTLLTTPATDDLGIGTGTWGTDVPYLQAGDVKASSGTRYALFVLRLPNSYVAGESVRLAIRAGMKTTVADTSCTLDVEAYKMGDGVISGSELVGAAAQSINSLTFADLNFELTATTLSAGDLVAVRLAVAYVDAATGTVVRPVIAKITAKLDVKG